MVAYSFNKRFVPAIREGLKTHTLRAMSKRRHARVGEALQLYTGMRTRQCRLIGTATCDRLLGVWLDFEAITPVVFFDVTESAPGRYYPTPGRRLAPLADHPDAFARSDGFAGIDDMARFWRDTHGVTRWEGFLIGWTGFVPGGSA